MTSSSQQERLIELINPLISPLGYEIVFLEVHTHSQKTLRVFIDRLDGQPIGVEDCATVSRAVDEPLDKLPEIEAVFRGKYELEVSSPGIDRPLRAAKDFQRFTGREARIFVIRPLTAEEIENRDYQQKHPKQKSFLGVLKGIRNEKVALAPLKDDGSKAPKKKGRNKPDTNSEAEVLIPLPLISKANLEPRFEPADDKE